MNAYQRALSEQAARRQHARDIEDQHNLSARLTACHGSKRSASILAGTDGETNADIAAWRNLGSRS